MIWSGAMTLLERHQSLKDTVKRARHYGAIARDALGIFPDGPIKSVADRYHRILYRSRFLEFSLNFPFAVPEGWRYKERRQGVGV